MVIVFGLARLFLNNSLKRLFGEGLPRPFNVLTAKWPQVGSCQSIQPIKMASINNQALKICKTSGSQRHDKILCQCVCVKLLQLIQISVLKS